MQTELIYAIFFYVPLVVSVVALAVSVVALVVSRRNRKKLIARRLDEVRNESAAHGDVNHHY